MVRTAASIASARSGATSRATAFPLRAALSSAASSSCRAVRAASSDVRYFVSAARRCSAQAAAFACSRRTGCASGNGAVSFSQNAVRSVTSSRPAAGSVEGPSCEAAARSSESGG